MSTNFKEAVNTKVVGLGNVLTPIQQQEYKHLDEVISNLQTMNKTKEYNDYLYCLPEQFVKSLISGKEVLNKWGRRCTVTNIWYVPEEKDYSMTIKWENKSWKMWLRTALKDFKWIGLKKNVVGKYFIKLNEESTNNTILHLQAKKDKYSKMYTQDQKRSSNIIGRELAKHTNEMIVSREAIRKSIISIQRDSRVMADAWNSTLNTQEQQTLINWLAKNVYSMRLYVVKGSRWDKAISELYPSEQYGKPRQTIPSELSKDSINGYVSVSSLDGIPYELLKKITHKQKDEDVVKQNKGSSKYRINNYLLVLYLLNNYNQIGFKIGKTNLNKEIKAI